MKTRLGKAEPQKPGKKRIEMWLLDLYSACLRNAEDLVAEAELLLSHGHHARAFALAFTAYEEIGKSQLVADRFETRVSEKEFEAAFREHALKAAYESRHVRLERVQGARGYEATIEYDEKGARPLVSARMDALYVSITGTKTPQEPRDVITPEVARRAIDGCRKQLEEIRFAEMVTERIGTASLTK